MKYSLIISLLLIVYYSSAQIMDMTWYDMTYTERKIQEQKNRDYRAEYQIKSISMTDTIVGEELSIHKFDPQGRTIYVKNRSKSVYASSSNFEKKDNLLMTECKYTFDKQGNLIEAEIFQEEYAGTAYGLSNKKNGENGLPFVGGPYKKNSTQSKYKWSYEYGKKGAKIAQSDETEFEPYKNQKRYSASSYDAPNSTKWKYQFEYNKKGWLIRRMEFSADSNRKKPIYSLEFEYNKSGQVIKEIKKSGYRVQKETLFKYDSKGNIIEKKAPYSKMTFEYNKENLISKIELFNYNGDSKNTIAYVYEGLNLIEKQVKGMVVNNYYKNETYSYTLDDTGRVQTKTLDNKVWTYEYY